MRPAFVLAASVLAAAPVIAQEDALKRLESSPRHQEWAQVKSGFSSTAFEKSLKAAMVSPRRR